MAAISSISNSEAMSSVRTKLNSVITEINLLDPTDWTDYSATSTIVGWSSSTKSIRYRVIGKQVFVIFYIDGTSNSATTTFTLPFNSITYNETMLRIANNGAIASGFLRIRSNANYVEAGPSITSFTWTASGTKTISGQFFYDIA